MNFLDETPGSVGLESWETHYGYARKYRQMNLKSDENYTYS
jgi:hypothetical protein